MQRMSNTPNQPQALPKRRHKGERGDFTEEQTADLLRDFYVVLEHRQTKTRLVKRTLAAVRAAGATFDNTWAVDILKKFIEKHHEYRRTSPLGTNKLLNTTKANRPEEGVANRPDFEHVTEPFSEPKQAGEETNRPDFEHVTGRKKVRVRPQSSFSISSRSDHDFFPVESRLTTPAPAHTHTHTRESEASEQRAPLEMLYELEPRVRPPS
jgi:hypothetical protein